MFGVRVGLLRTALMLGFSVTLQLGSGTGTDVRGGQMPHTTNEPSRTGRPIGWNRTPDISTGIRRINLASVVALYESAIKLCRYKRDERAPCAVWRQVNTVDHRARYTTMLRDVARRQLPAGNKVTAYGNVLCCPTSTEQKSVSKILLAFGLRDALSKFK